MQNKTLSFALLLAAMLVSTYAISDSKPWIGVYKSTTSIMPAKLLKMAIKKGEDVEDSYPTVHLLANGTIETRLFKKVESSGQYRIRGENLIVTYTNKATGIKSTDAQNAFSDDFNKLTLGKGTGAMTFTRKPGLPKVPAHITIK